MSDSLQVGGIVLCGGRSSRMGQSKATLPFGSELMLQRVVRLLAEVVEPVVVVAAAGQTLPDLPAGIIVARDQREACGPLEGLRVGITAIADRADAVYVTSCDVPLLSAAFVRRMIAELGDHDAAVVVDGELVHALAGVYRTSTVTAIERLLGEGNRRMSDLVATLLTRRVAVEQLRQVDPELRSLMNVNTPDEFVRALKRAAVSIDSPPDRQTDL